ncbi:MAG: hypothetical protein ACLP0H_11850, partial [Terriglobales bacterium]
RPDPNPPTILKQRADSVPYGEQISTRGGCVWCAFSPEGILVVVGATADEARFKYREIRKARKPCSDRLAGG